MAKLLLIEDEENIRKIIAYDLLKAGHEIVECSDGKEAMQAMKKNRFDVMLIDWMLPKMSGIEIVKEVRKQEIDSILIMLTARCDEDDILYAFEMGVDDYITKPFSPKQMMARINAHLKRFAGKQESFLQMGDLTIDLKRREASIGDQEMVLTKKEFELLEYLVQNKNVVVSRDSVLNAIWGFDYDGDTRIVDVHIFKLRNKLNGSQLQIKASRGIGYLLEVKKDEK